MCPRLTSFDYFDTFDGDDDFRIWFLFTTITMYSVDLTKILLVVSVYFSYNVASHLSTTTLRHC